MGGFKSPNAVEFRVLGKARQSRHLLQIVNQETGVKLHLFVSRSVSQNP
jgi:hypothetical protein